MAQDFGMKQSTRNPAVECSAYVARKTGFFIWNIYFITVCLKKGDCTRFIDYVPHRFYAYL